MTGAGRRWAGRLRRLAQIVGDGLSKTGTGMWWPAPPPAGDLAADLAGDGHPEPVEWDPRELDAWLERVLRDGPQ